MVRALDRWVFLGVLLSLSVAYIVRTLQVFHMTYAATSSSIPPSFANTVGVLSTTLERQSILSTVENEWLQDIASRRNEVVMTPDQPVIDVISIGSTNRFDYQTAQQSTWASHSSIRHFFNVTEQLDQYRNCTEDVMTLNPEGSTHWKDTKWVDLIRQCYKWSKQKQELQAYRYFRIHWVNQKPNPAGWFCAQPRFGNSIRLVGEFYRRQQQTLASKEVLPDYLILLDDDSYIQMDLLLENFRNINPTIPMVWVGCLNVFIKYGMPRHGPYGGLATIFSRGAVEHLMLTRLHCPSSSNDDAFVKYVCSRLLNVDMIYEAHSFENGMTLSDLVGAYANRIPSCLFSDWLVGYFVHTYRLSATPYNLSSTLSSYLHPIRDSFAVSTEHGLDGFEGRGMGCAGNSGCNESTIICHYLSPDQMRTMSTRA